MDYVFGAGNLREREGEREKRKNEKEYMCERKRVR